MSTSTYTTTYRSDEVTRSVEMSSKGPPPLYIIAPSRSAANTCTGGSSTMHTHENQVDTKIRSKTSPKVQNQATVSTPLSLSTLSSSLSSSIPTKSLTSITSSSASKKRKKSSKGQTRRMKECHTALTSPRGSSPITRSKTKSSRTNSPELRKRSFIGAIDQRTTKTRFVVVDSQGLTVAAHEINHKILRHRRGGAEIDAEQIIVNIHECIEKVLKILKELPTQDWEIVGIGISNQIDTAVVWDSKSNKPLHNCLISQDQQNRSLLDEFNSSVGGLSRFKSKCGAEISTQSTALKLKWMLKNLKAITSLTPLQKSQLKVGTIDSWILYKLCGGVHKTDITNASRTLLMNLSSHQWDNELCNAFDVPIEALPQIVSCSENIGTLTVTALRGVCIMGCLAANQATALGKGCIKTGDVSNIYGSQGSIHLNTGTRLCHPLTLSNRLATVVGYKLGDFEPVVYATEATIPMAGSCIEWLRDEMQMIKSVSECEDLARNVDDTADTYFVPSGLDPCSTTDGIGESRGCIIGLTRYTNRSHICRAILEAVCFQTVELMDLMARNTNIQPVSIKASGGMVANDLMLQIQSNMSGIPVYLPITPETSAALGAVYAAGLACGVWNSVEDIRNKCKIKKTWKPKTTALHRQAKLNRWHDAFEKSKKWST